MKKIKDWIKQEPIGAAVAEFYLYLMGVVFAVFIICEIVNYLQYGKF